MENETKIELTTEEAREMVAQKRANQIEVEHNTPDVVEVGETGPTESTPEIIEHIVSAEDVVNNPDAGLVEGDVVGLVADESLLTPNPTE